jgi:hypothetical protein
VVEGGDAVEEGRKTNLFWETEIMAGRRKKSILNRERSL